MYWTRFPRRDDLEGGATLVHGASRLNIAPADLTAFVDPADAALAFGFRSLDPDDTFDKSFPVWMATVRRRAGTDAIMESLQRVFTQLANDESLVQLVVDTARHALALGYGRLWFAPALYGEPLLASAMRNVAEIMGALVELVATSGLTSIALLPRGAA